jgi:AAHS family 4-hydroxybenzoate transporter-like MFS transporter
LNIRPPTTSNVPDQPATTASPAAVDVGAELDRGAWTSYQKLLTLLAAAAIIFDGFDIQILGFAIPSIMREWHVARAAFAPVLAIGLAGMAVGSPLAGYLGDRFGRRVALIGCLALFGAATIATAFSHGLLELAVLRFITGMGAGGAIPNAGALAAEFAPLRWRPVAVTLTIVCVPLGGMIGGLVAARILPASGWHMLYVVGGTAPLILAVVLLCLLPESPRYLARRAPPWDELARLLRRMGHSVPAGAAFDDRLEQAAESRTALKSLLGSDYFRDTLALWFAFFCCLSAVYLVFGWLPAMLTGQGLDLATASSGLAAYNFGGVLGVLIWAGLVSLVGSRIPLLFGSLCGAASALALQFVSFQPGHSHALLIAGLGLHGLFVNAVQTTLYALAAHVYPTKVRASGVAAAASIGRLGAILSSFTGALIIQAGSASYLRVLAVSLICSTIGLAAVRKHFQRSSMG